MLFINLMNFFQVVSYLPLSHVAGTFIDIYLSMWGGGTVHFADKMALQGTLLKVLLLFSSRDFQSLFFRLWSRRSQPFSLGCRESMKRSKRR